MKLNRIILITLLSFLCIGINAQYFAGGSIGFHVRNGQADNGTENTDELKIFNTNLSPTAGVFLSDKFAIGLALNTGFNKQETGVDVKIIRKTTFFGLSPFIKYYAVKWNKISLYGKGTIEIDYSKSNSETSGLETITRNTDIGLGFYPGLSYDLSDKLLLQTSLNFLGFGCRYRVTKNLETDAKSSETYFSLRADTHNIATIGDITIGAIYRF